MKISQEILETLGYHMVKTISLYLTWAWNDRSVTGRDTWTNTKTERQRELS